MCVVIVALLLIAAERTEAVSAGRRSFSHREPVCKTTVLWFTDTLRSARRDSIRRPALDQNLASAPLMAD
jgi:hypothetical protein